MNNQIVKNTTPNFQQSLLNDMRLLINKYRGKFEAITDSALQEMIVKSMFEVFGIENKIKTEYQDYYCDLFINYARNNVEPSGFWGEYCLDEGMKEDWMNNHRFKQTMALVPNLTANIMNKNISNLVQVASKTNDTKTSTQIVLKLMDIKYRADKDMGVIKDRGIDNKNSKKRSASEIDDVDAKMAEDFLNGE